MKLKKSIRHNIAFFIVFFWIVVFRALSRRAGIILAKLLALVFYAAAGFHRKNTIAHLTMAFGHEKTTAEIHRLARRVFLHFATAGVDAIRIPIYSGEDLDRMITDKNLHYMEAARAGGKSFVLLTGHFGNWELMGAWLGRKKLNLHVVGAALSNPKINKLIVDARNKAGYVNIERGNATKGIIQAVKRGFPVALLIDQDTRARGVFVNFFGKKAHTPVGPAVLAGMLSVPILPMAMYLKKDLTYEMECFPPLYYDDTGDREKDVFALTQKCSDVYEQIIRRHPEQWAWMHLRWRKQPEDRLRRKYLFSATD